MYDTTKPYKDDILALIKDTWGASEWLAVDGHGSYPVLAKKFQCAEIDHTDGIGTKGVQHWYYRTFHSAVLDALAMNLNDLATMGAEAYKTQVHLIVPEDDHDAILEITKHLCAECKKFKIAVTGGETSIQNNVQGMELSLTMSGIVKELRRNCSELGDWLFGLPSSGLHSNGFTLASRYIPNSAVPGDWKKELTTPTRIYYNDVLDILRKYQINGMVHIAGGGWTRLHSLLPKNTSAELIVRDGKPLGTLPVFTFLSKFLDDETMYKTFNCGFGFVLSIERETAVNIARNNPWLIPIGRVVQGDGTIIINSPFSDRVCNV